ncbi:glycine betaine ABC transporter substrate-binding protein [Arthrobacter castelli]|uniref:glycine betaine ABC transporter substrate-binding protein n=1 Tax=Arthrobacter castelli TaxID=271431 RepID=UPI00040876D5|nr:glycine betaine ABC transporter substrate-binding protein [Arthrobacter castelli]
MKKRFTSIAAMGMITALALAGCGGDTGGSEGGGNTDGSGGGGGETSAASLEGKELTIGVFSGWPEGRAVSELWQHILEEKGMTVNLETAKAGPAFSGLAAGDYDLLMDVWLPTTHEQYLKEHGDSITELGAWNDAAKLTIATNADAPIDSLTELAENAEKFDNRLIGIEPGAGLTEATTEEVIPTYGLEGMEYITSSTPAMLSELKSAMEADENIVVTLWRPHWAYNAFDIKDLKDPKNTLGTAESIYSYGSKNIKEEYPKVAKWISNFKMKNDLLYSLENVMFNKNETDKYDPIIDKWVSENQEYVDSLTAK